MKRTIKQRVDEFITNTPKGRNPDIDRDGRDMADWQCF